MPKIDYFSDAPIEEEFKAAAARVNERLNHTMNDALLREVAVQLCECADKRDYEGFRVLALAYPQAINGYDAAGDTPLICATHVGSDKIVDFALEVPGIDINAPGEGGTTAYMWACEKSFTDIGKAFLRKPELDAGIEDEDGDTAIILAVESENTELVRGTLEKPGVDVEEEDGDGNSARMLAEAYPGKTADQRDILTMIKAHGSYTGARKAAPEQDNTPKEKRARKTPRTTIDPAKAVLPLAKPPSYNDPRHDQIPAEMKKYPYPHSIALLKWCEGQYFKTYTDAVGRIQYNGSKLTTPSIQNFISGADALYVKGKRSAYDPKMLAICEHIGYDPSVDYPLAEGPKRGPQPKDNRP